MKLTRNYFVIIAFILNSSVIFRCASHPQVALPESMEFEDSEEDSEENFSGPLDNRFVYFIVYYPSFEND